MTNIQRIQIEVQDINLSQEELTVYLQENELQPHDEYNPKSATNKRNIYRTALSILESIANNPSLMKAYKQDDISVFQFAENIQGRIDQLERKIRTMKTDDQNSNYFMLFNN